MNTFSATAETACEINSVSTADTIHAANAMRSPLIVENEVGLSQVSSDTSPSTTVNQYHSRHGSEHNLQPKANISDSPSASTVLVSNSLVSGRKQQLQQKTKNNLVLSSSLSSLSTSPSSNSSDSATTTINKSSPVLQKYLQLQQKEECNKRSSLPDWFPSNKRNSLILLADQNLEQLQKKKNNNSPNMVAPMQEQPQTANTTATFDVDSSEELQYGPGMKYIS